MAGLAYSAAIVLASVGLEGVERDDMPVTLPGWAAAAQGRGAAVALLLSAALSLCGLPLGVGFWANSALRANLPAMPTTALLILQAAPLVAAIGWWRVLRASAQGQEGGTQPLSRAAKAFFWTLALLSAAFFIWPAPLARLAEALARAFGSL
jgi:NADH:ubiquinone oxidoreductase subunit 2 (subunit N)